MSDLTHEELEDKTLVSVLLADPFHSVIGPLCDCSMLKRCRAGRRK